MSSLVSKVFAALAAVCLLLGGLVGVAAPANAAALETCGTYTPESEQDLTDTKGKEICDAKNLTFVRWSGPIGAYLDTWVAKGTAPIELPERPECGEGESLVWDGGWECIPGGSGPECAEGEYLDVSLGECVLGEPEVGEPVQKAPPPPPCWSGEAGNNCPVGGALRFAAPEYTMVGVPVTMYAYASWRPDGNSPAQPTNGTAVIRVDGEDYSGVEFKDGVASWRFIPETEGMKEFTASGVVFSNTSGASAYIDTVPARTYVLEYDPAAYADAFKNKLVEVGERYVITDIDQARSYLKGQYDWRVADKSEDVCAVYETKKGAVKAKFNEAGKCKVIWEDTQTGDKGNFTFIAEK